MSDSERYRLSLSPPAPSWAMTVGGVARHIHHYAKQMDKWQRELRRSPQDIIRLNQEISQRHGSEAAAGQSNTSTTGEDISQAKTLLDDRLLSQERFCYDAAPRDDRDRLLLIAVANTIILQISSIIYPQLAPHEQNLILSCIEKLHQESLGGIGNQKEHVLSPPPKVQRNERDPLIGLNLVYQPLPSHVIQHYLQSPAGLIGKIFAYYQSNEQASGSRQSGLAYQVTGGEMDGSRMNVRFAGCPSAMTLFGIEELEDMLRNSSAVN